MTISVRYIRPYGRWDRVIKAMHARPKSQNSCRGFFFDSTRMYADRCSTMSSFE